MRQLLLIVSLGVLFLVGSIGRADESTANDGGGSLVFTSFRGMSQPGC